MEPTPLRVDSHILPLGNDMTEGGGRRDPACLICAGEGGRPLQISLLALASN